MNILNESVLENVCLEWLAELGWMVLHGPDLAPGMPGQEREDYRQIFLLDRLRNALTAINPDVPSVGIEEALRRILAVSGPDIVSNNRTFHRLLTDGVDV
jgi:type I restriction enzyme R subunit